MSCRKFTEILFGPAHPYGYFTKPEDYDLLSRKSLMDFDRAHYVSDHCTILLSGKVDQEVIATVNGILGRNDWMKGNGIPESFYQAQISMRKRYPAYYWAAFMLVE